MTLDTMTSLAEMATTIPGASRVFQRHRLDFCCGGTQSLVDACRSRALDPDQVAAEIAATVPSTADEVGWDRVSLEALIVHIIRHYHDPLRLELPRLVALARRVERAHAPKPECPHGLADHLRAMDEAVTQHLAKEERILFPSIAAGRGPHAGMPIRVLMDEHLDHAVTLERTRALTNDFTTPPTACPAWRALYLRLTELEAELHRHIHLENNVLFPRALQAA